MERRRKLTRQPQRQDNGLFYFLGTRTTEEGDCVTTRPRQQATKEWGRPIGQATPPPDKHTESWTGRDQSGKDHSDHLVI